MSLSGQEPSARAEEVKVAEEMAAQPDEPLLPIEKKLIAGSLILGVALLGLLIWLSNTFFPIPAGPE
jgi:hypothetical protein